MLVNLHVSTVKWEFGVEKSHGSFLCWNSLRVVSRHLPDHPPMLNMYSSGVRTCLLFITMIQADWHILSPWKRTHFGIQHGWNVLQYLCLGVIYSVQALGCYFWQSNPFSLFSARWRIVLIFWEVLCGVLLSQHSVECWALQPISNWE